MKQLLSQSDFRLFEEDYFTTNSRYHFTFISPERIDYPKLGENWPFHTTEEDKKTFLEQLGMEDYYEVGISFPETPTKEEALLILVNAINDFNSRQ